MEKMIEELDIKGDLWLEWQCRKLDQVLYCNWIGSICVRGEIDCILHIKL